MPKDGIFVAGGVLVALSFWVKDWAYNILSGIGGGNQGKIFAGIIVLIIYLVPLIWGLSLISKAIHSK